jgi:hypothetical protein
MLKKTSVDELFAVLILYLKFLFKTKQADLKIVLLYQYMMIIKNHLIIKFVKIIKNKFSVHWSVHDLNPHPNYS